MTDHQHVWERVRVLSEIKDPAGNHVGYKWREQCSGCGATRNKSEIF